MRILLVEDSEKHLNDALEVVERIKSKEEIDVVCAGTLEEALKMLSQCDVLVSDVFFPEMPGEAAESSVKPPWDGYKNDEMGWVHYAEQHISGVKLAKASLALGIPVVLCTSSYHHADKTQPACSWARCHGMELVDSYSATREKDATTKEWTTAFLFALYMYKSGKKILPHMYNSLFTRGREGFLQCLEKDPVLKDAVILFGISAYGWSA